MDAVTSSARPTQPLPGVASPLAAALLSGVLVWLTWWALVNTRHGQLLDALALEGARIGSTRLDDSADQLLATVSVPMVAAIIVVVLLIGVLRGRWVAGVAAAVAVAGANVSTRLLKYHLFERDDLVGLGAWNGNNTLPSGHTTVAAAALVGLVLVVPPTLRALTTAVGVVAVSAYGLATLVNHWHRPSDVVAAVFVACAWGYLAVAAIRIAERRGPRRDERHRPGAASVILVTFAICGLALASAAAFLVWGVELVNADRTSGLIAYFAGIAVIGGVSCGGLGALLRLLDATRPVRRSPEPVRPPTTAAAPVPPG